MLKALRRRDGEDGFALLTVIMTMFVLFTIVGGALTYAIQTQIGSRRDQDFNSALQAARAGVDDMLARLNKNDTYWQSYPGYNVNSAPDCSNLAWQRPALKAYCNKAAYGTVYDSTTVGWVQIPGSNGSSYHYDLDLSGTPTEGVVLITSTGKSKKVTRTVQVALRHDGFGEFLYLTDYETVDPSNEAVYGFNNAAAAQYCSLHYYEGRNSACSDLNFITGDVINGPLHSNDAMLELGSPDFKGTVTTSWPACNGVTQPSQYANRCYRPNGAATPTFEKGLAYKPYYQIPNSIGALKSYTDTTKYNPAGCLYTGPTRIVFNSNGTMKVWSNWSATLNPGCGNPKASWPQTVNVPSNNVIYVQDVPATQTSPAPITTSCPTGSIGDGLPVANDYNNTLREAACNSGTVYIEGTLSGRVTVAADNNVIITDDLTYAGGANGVDALGLIANNSVKVYHPVKCTNLNTSTNICSSGTNLNRPNGGGVFTDPVIQACILTLQHSFTVQSYQLGSPLGTLNLYGSFSQRYRGPVGTSSNGNPSSGFLKNYVYDSRLKYAPPPYFLDPVSSPWGPKTFGEVQTPAAYRAS